MSSPFRPPRGYYFIRLRQTVWILGSHYPGDSVAIEDGTWIKRQNPTLKVCVVLHNGEILRIPMPSDTPV